MADERPLLSVVIVTYNEADRVSDCIESVLSACEDIDEFEVILVDGNSTDGTVSIASEYPITVLRTAEDVISTPSSGRYVGTEMASGQYVLFVDGDTKLANEWIETAIQRMEDDPELVGAGGYFNEVEGSGSPEDVEYLGRTMMYERAALREVGGFDPYMSALEDIDVGFRLGRAGYRLCKYPVVVGYHPELGGIGERVRRWRQGFYYGNGEVMRKYLDSPPMLAKWLRRFTLSFGVFGWAGLGAAAALRRGNRSRLGWVLGSVLLLGLALYKRDGDWVRQKLFSILILQPIGMARGFLQYPSSPPEYPLGTVEVVHEPADLQAEA